MGLAKLNVSGSRNHNYLKQLKGSVLYKLGAIGSTFITMPITIKYLGIEQFGVWATMLTLLTWVMMFDLGISHGLKNKIAESIAENNLDQAASYISTAYILVGFVAVFIFIVFIFFSPWVSWQRIFNTEILSEGLLSEAIFALSFFVFLNFWLSLVNQIYHGLQRTSMVVFGQFLSNVLALIFIFLLYHFTRSSVFLVVCSYGLSLVGANLLLTFFVCRSNRVLAPSLNGFDKSKIMPLLSLGGKFFIIQLSILLIFLTDKMLISQLLGPEYIVPYEILFRLFSVFTMVHGLLIAPLWPAYSDAYQRGELDWIGRSIKQQLKIAVLIFFGAFAMVAIGPFIVRYWIGNEVLIDKSLYFAFAVFIILSVWNNIFSIVLGAIGKIRLGAIHTFFSALMNVPLCMFLVRFFDFGVAGVVYATIISISLSAVISPIQAWYFIVYKRKITWAERVLS